MTRDAAMNAPATDADAAAPGVPARAPAPPRRSGPLLAAWAGLALAAVAGLFPLRFSAEATLAFDVAAQPPAATVRGVAQLLQSREMAFDAVDRLAPDDVARLAAASADLTSAFGGALDPETDTRTLRARAAWRLARALTVTPDQGGRRLRVCVSAPGAGLAARAADAYAAAFVALDGSARAAPETAESPGLPPPVRVAAPARAPALPDPPRLHLLVLLAGAVAGLLLAGRRRRRREAAPSGTVSAGALPVEVTDGRRIIWLEKGGEAGADLGFGEAEAVERLAALAREHAIEHAAAGGLVVVTSDDMPEASAACAVALARHLADEARVALVALDGTAEDLAALISDPWAPGMSELLFGVAGFGETIHRDPRSRAHVIPPGRGPRGGPSVVGAERLGLILRALRQTYDHVVVAAPALPEGAGTARLAALDPLLVCIHADVTPATTAVESYDAIAARRFRTVAMLCLATEAGILARVPAPPLEGDARDFAAAFGAAA